MNNWVGRPINLFRSKNNIPHVKRGRISSCIKHLQVWTGLDHVDSVIFDQVHIHCLDTLYPHDGLRNLNGGQLAWARWHIWMGPIVEKSTCYIWRGGKPLYSCLDYYLLWYVETFLPLSVKQGCSVVEHKGVPSRESLPHPQGRRNYWATFPHY